MEAIRFKPGGESAADCLEITNLGYYQTPGLDGSDTDGV